MINSERYNRQSLIKDWNQKKLVDARGTLIGSGRLSDLILADLLSMGIGNITRIGCSDFLEFEKINPEVYLEQRDESLTNMQLAELCIENGDFVIDATNTPESKFFSSEVARARNMLYASACSDYSGFLLGFNKTGRELVSSNEEYYGRNQGNVYSILCSAFVADELRKRLMPLGDEVRAESYKYHDVQEHPLEKRVLQVGAGAIGNFSALGLALLNSDIDIVDFDVVEETNLNRQFMFYEAVGLRKAEVLAERLRRFTKNVRARTEKIGETFNPTGYDFVFSCVDNNEARYHMNQAAKKYNVPLINGGSSLFAGNAMPYFPGQTACLNCQTNFKLSEALTKTREKRQPGECFQPSLIISNQIVAGLMITSLLKSLNGVHEKSNYVSGCGIYNQNVDRTCMEQCR